MWGYSELYSFPFVMVLGEVHHGELRGYISLPLINWRVNVLLRDDGSHRVVHNIPPDVLDEKYIEWARDFAVYGKEPDDAALRIARDSAYYGGINIFLIIGQEPYLFSAELIRAAAFSFYLRPRRYGNEDISRGNLADWALLAFGLREGLRDIVMKACRALGGDAGDACVLRTASGDLAITGPAREIPGFAKVFPDNSPMRHVVKFKEYKGGSITML